MRDWVAEDDPVHFILEAVDRVDLSAFKVKRTRAGKSQYPPRMLLALLIYSYSHGLFGSRRIERATYRDVCVRYLTGDTHPDHDTICAFRRENHAAFTACFLEVLLLARELKLFKLGTVAIDGTHLRANASKDRNVTYERAQQLETRLSADIAALCARAEQADNTEVDERLPAEIARRQSLREQMDAAQRTLQARAKERATAQRPAYEAKLQARQERKGNGKGRRPKPPSDQPDPVEQTNLSDPDSRLMRKGNSSAVTQSYNAQASVDADGSQLVVSAHISQCSADNGELEAGIQNIPTQLGSPEQALADSG
ncbi:transposase, partial [Cerasicoccus maritimus]|uniref:transposase n=1 Tax=Cerasicoccus maritimus TaxID=490089 RepID=UPI002852D256